jgi:hypothetical protein
MIMSNVELLVDEVGSVGVRDVVGLVDRGLMLLREKLGHDEPLLPRTLVLTLRPRIIIIDAKNPQRGQYFVIGTIVVRFFKSSCELQPSRWASSTTPGR